MNHQQTTELYPRYCFHLSPTWNTWCFFKAAELHKLDKPEGFEGENFYFYDKLPIKWVRIVGLIVAIDDFAGRRVYTIDDSSGACIEVVETLVVPKRCADDTAASTGATSNAQLKAPARSLDQQKHANKHSTGPSLPEPPLKPVTAYPDLDVCMIVDVKGKLTDFREERQINLEKFKLVRCTQEEILLWEKRAKFKRDVLEDEWIVDKHDLKKAKREAERQGELAARKKRKVESAKKKREEEEQRKELEEEARVKERDRRKRLEEEGMRLAMGEQAGPSAVEREKENAKRLRGKMIKDILRDNPGKFKTLGF